MLSFLPKHAAIVGPGRAEVHVFVREDAGAEIGHAAVDQHAGAHRPAGNHFASGKDRIRRPAPDAASRRASLSRHRGSTRIRRRSRHTPGRCDGGRQPDRSVGEEVPEFLAVVQIQAANLMIDRRSEVDAVADGRHVQGVVEANAVAHLPPFDHPSCRFGPGSARNGRRREEPCLP